MSNVSLVELFSSIQGEGTCVGYRQAFLRFHGCNLHCSYCDTVQPEAPTHCRVEDDPGSGIFRELPNPLPLGTVMEILCRWRDSYPGLHHSLSLTGGEPLLHRDTMIRWLPELRTILPLYLESNGTLPETLAEVVDHLDYISMDIKLPSASGSPPLWDMHRRFLEVAVQRKLFVKLIVAPDTSSEEITTACLLVSRVEPTIPLILQPVTRNGGSAVTGELLLRFQEQATRFLSDVRVIPQTHVFLNLL